MHEPADVVPAWQDAWNRADADHLAALFAEDADFVNVVGLWWHDRSSIRDAHDFGFRTIFPGSVITMAEPRVRRLGTDAAVVQSRWHLTGQISPAGEAAGPREGIFTFVLERRTQGWVAVTAQNTDIAPGAQTHLNSAAGQSPVHYRPRTS
ncbi:YybH family protein [Leucobacter sp. M11]|uniref:YybH family protein n=1 Tax=Leucobacter sp. M11 TaxID=2993565 RepID=UPI002D7F3D86|nr:SgcJ/EcaC family oxidoreductase [Leucobacter sp. M11]MEB4614550.1 SgcJ/EcaC family oxidoreductase [Leucobacter sp. M11]